MKNDDGYIIIIAVLILLLLTIIGISASSISRFESEVSTNFHLYEKAFYTADSGWHVAAVYLDDQFPMITQDTGTNISGGAANFVMTQDKFAAPDLFPMPNTNNLSYSVSARFDGAEYAKLWDVDLFMQYNYTLTSIGIGPANILESNNSRARVTVSARKIAEKGG